MGRKFKVQAVQNIQDVVAYKDRSAALDPPAAAAEPGSGVGLSLVAIDGRIRGSWRRSLFASMVRVSVTFGSRVTRGERRAVEAASARYGRFLGLDVQVDYPVPCPP